MQAFEKLTGIAVPLGLKNIDTDIIIPAVHLKSISRLGLGQHAFPEIRKTEGNVFDSERNQRAPILIAGDNFGCGSSREHAAWAIVDMGFRVLIAPSFADIFAGNSFKNGVLLIELPQDAIDRLIEVAPDCEITVDLDNEVVTTPFQDRFTFEIDPFRRHCLLNGLDEIGLTEQLQGEILAYEQRLDAKKPWLRDAAGAA